MTYFESHSISLILSWLSCSFFFVALIAYVFSIFAKVEGIPHIVTIWLSLCILLLSPLRYMFLQGVIASAYPFQSISNFLSSLIVGLYLPIVYALLVAIGFALPALATLWIAEGQPYTKAKLFLICLLTPVGCVLSSFLFAMLVPYAAISIHWLKVKGILQATNGPAAYFHKYAVDVWNPMELFVTEEQRNHSLQEHIASVYFGTKQKKSYEKVLTFYHFCIDRGYWESGNVGLVAVVSERKLISSWLRAYGERSEPVQDSAPPWATNSRPVPGPYSSWTEPAHRRRGTLRQARE